MENYENELEHANKQLAELISNEILNEESKLQEQQNVQNKAPEKRIIPPPQMHSENTSSMSKLTGWNPVILSEMPSKGKFYKPGMKIYIRAATVGEIRHWSTMDETSMPDIDSHINTLLEKCTLVQKMYNGTEVKSVYTDIMEVDRIYLVLAIRELTMVSGNEIMIPVEIEAGTEKKIKLTKDSIHFYKEPEILSKYYSEDNKCWVVGNDATKIWLPTIKVGKLIFDYFNHRKNSSKNIDAFFLRISTFIIPPDCKTEAGTPYTFQDLDNLNLEIQKWNLKKITGFTNIIDAIKNSINPSIKYLDDAGVEVLGPLEFQNGIRSLFLEQMGDSFDW